MVHLGGVQMFISRQRIQGVQPWAIEMEVVDLLKVHGNEVLPVRYLIGKE